MKKLFKKICVVLLLIILQASSHACPVCERNKPKIFRNITHGSNPESNWDYLIVIGMIIIAISTLIYSIKWFIKPNEDDKTHIKYSILNDQ